MRYLPTCCNTFGLAQSPTSLSSIAVPSSGSMAPYSMARIKANGSRLSIWARSLLMRSMAAAPSVTGAEFPAVSVPFLEHRLERRQGFQRGVGAGPGVVLHAQER